MSEQSSDIDLTVDDQAAGDKLRIAAAMAELDRLNDTELGQQLAIFEGVHAELRDILANAGRDGGSGRPS